MMQPIPTLSQVYRLVLQEKKQRECNKNFSIGVDSTALAAPYNKFSQSTGNSKWQSNNYHAQGNVYGNAHGNTHCNTHSNAQGIMFGIAPNGRRSKFFCTNCKVWGHSLDRCFNFNPFNKDKKKSVNCAVDGNALPMASTDTAPVATSFIQKQMQQLISLLTAQNLEPSSSQSQDMSSAFMAGKRFFSFPLLIHIIG